jgi:hypothetical protein
MNNLGLAHISGAQTYVKKDTQGHRATSTLKDDADLLAEFCANGPHL